MLLLRGGALYSKPVQSGSALQAASHAVSDNGTKGRLVPVLPVDVLQHPAGRICVYVGAGGTVVAPVVVIGCVVATVVVGCVVATVVMGCVVTTVVRGCEVATVVVNCVVATVVVGCVVATVVVGCVVATVVVGCVVATVVVGCVVATVVVGCVVATVVVGCVVATVVVGCVAAVVMGWVVATVVVGCVEDVRDGAAAQIFGSQHFALSTAEHPGYLDDCWCGCASNNVNVNGQHVTARESSRRSFLNMNA
jgi:hypothetical protein